jgi:hypothetical protein
MPKPTPTGTPTARGFRDARGHRVDVELGRAGHALQRHVIDVAAGQRATGDALSVEVGASRKIGSSALAFMGAAKLALSSGG